MVQFYRRRILRSKRIALESACAIAAQKSSENFSGTTTNGQLAEVALRERLQQPA